MVDHLPTEEEIHLMAVDRLDLLEPDHRRHHLVSQIHGYLATAAATKVGPAIS
jgi:hypothetical protein